MAAAAILLYVGACLALLSLIAGFARRSTSPWSNFASALLLLLDLGFLAGDRSPLLFGAPLTASLALLEKLLAAVWWGLAACSAGSLVQFTLGHDGRSRQSRLLSDLLSGTLYVGALLAVLVFVLKLPLSGLLATSGIAAVVLGLALQNTLSDLFSGIAVGVEQPFRVGDRISIGDHVEGTVSQINWRSIRISTDEDDVAIIPNSAVAKAEIVNRSYPGDQLGRRVDINALAAAAPERVERLIGHALLLVPAILETPAPTVNLKRLGSRTNGYEILYFIAGDGSSGRVRSEMLRQIRARFLHAGILDGQALSPEASGTGDFARMAIFASLGDKQLQHLRSIAIVCSLEAGDALFEEGDEDDNLYVVSDGVLEVRRTGPGARIETGGRLGSGDFIGEIGLLTGESKKVAAIAITAALVSVFPKSDICALLGEAPALAALLAASARRGYVLIDTGKVAALAELLPREAEFLPRIRAFLGHYARRGGGAPH